MLRLSAGGGGGGGGHPLLPHSGGSRAGGRPPSPSKSALGKGVAHRVQRAMMNTPNKLLAIGLMALLTCTVMVYIVLGGREAASPPVDAVPSVQHAVSVRPRLSEGDLLAAEPPPATFNSDAPSPKSLAPGDTERWMSHWLYLRGAVDALSIDVATHFPAPVQPQPQRLSPPVQRGRRGKTTQYYPPARPVAPLQAWAAGLPTSPAFATRDAFTSFFLLFPLPSSSEGSDTTKLRAPVVYEGVWDLRALAGVSPEMASGGSHAAGGALSVPAAFPFASLLDVHPSVSTTALDDLLRVRTQLRLAALLQGVRSDARTGEEAGKIVHHIPASSPSSSSLLESNVPTRSGRFTASDSTSLYVLACVHYFHLVGDLSLLDSLLPSLLAAYEYMWRHVDPTTGLVQELPAKFLGGGAEVEAVAEGGAADLSQGTDWQEDRLANRKVRTSDGDGVQTASPAYPVAYFLLQSQTLAAFRALRSLRASLASFVTATPTATADGGDSGGAAGSSDMGAVLRRWDDLIAHSSQPGVEVAIAQVKGALHTYFMRRPASGALKDDQTSSTKQSLSEFPTPASTPAEGRNRRCPLFGLDRFGSLGLSPPASLGPGGSLPSTPDTLHSIDPLHALFYLERGDVSLEELRAWLGTAQEGADAAAAAPSPPSDEAEATPRPSAPTCFDELETGIGWATSNIGYRAGAGVEAAGDGGSSDPAPAPVPTPTHRSLRPLEQALIHSAARRFQLARVEEVSARFFRRFERALVRRRRRSRGDGGGPQGEPTDRDVMPAYFTPATRSTESTAQRDANQMSLTLRSSHKDGARREQWESQGAHTQLGTAAAWSYWLTQQVQDTHALAARPSLLQQSRASHCQHEPEGVMRGVSSASRSRYCPSAAASAPPPGAPSSASSLLAFPAQVFTCLDSSALLWLSAVNDGYCDCPDGSDEVGTGACAHSDEEHAYTAATFACGDEAAAHTIPASMVGDGVCDCCNGADESASVIRCENTCSTPPHRGPRQSTWRPSAVLP